jgi:hypothetical protein
MADDAGLARPGVVYYTPAEGERAQSIINKRVVYHSNWIIHVNCHQVNSIRDRTCNLVQLAGA